MYDTATKNGQVPLKVKNQDLHDLLVLPRSLNHNPKNG